MPVLHEIVVTESIEIATAPALLFSYLTSIVDDASFKTLNADNISFRWLKGKPWIKGSIAYAEKFLHGKPHRFRFIVTEILPNRYIEYKPTSRLMRMFFPKKCFTLEHTTGGCRLISSATFRIGWIGKKLFHMKIQSGLTSFRKYLYNEGKNLKTILEAGEQGVPGYGPQAAPSARCTPIEYSPWADPDP
jgi:hypothetical protein